MNAPLPVAWLQPSPEQPARAAAGPDTPEAPEAARRMVWHSRHGTIEIEVIGQTVYVNGQAVQPATSPE